MSRRHDMVSAGCGLLSLLLCGCVLPATSSGDVRGAAGGAGIAERDAVLVPPGLGSLRQDDFTVSIQHGALLVKVTPLNEAVIRLASPDTYERLRAIAVSRRTEVAEATLVSAPELFLVSFFSYEPDITFRPEEIRLEQRGAMLEPLAILSLTPGWGRQRLEQQQTQQALYAYRPVFDLWLSLVVHYDMERSEQWARVIPRLESERARILSIRR